MHMTPKMRSRSTLLQFGLLISAIAAVITMTACQKGPAEKTGERIDNTIDQATQGHTEPFQKGPAQQAGENIDKATGH